MSVLQVSEGDFAGWYVGDNIVSRLMFPARIPGVPVPGCGYSLFQQREAGYDFRNRLNVLIVRLGLRTRLALRQRCLDSGLTGFRYK